MSWPPVPFRSVTRPPIPENANDVRLSEPAVNDSAGVLSTSLVRLGFEPVAPAVDSAASLRSSVTGAGVAATAPSLIVITCVAVEGSPSLSVIW